MATSKLRSPLLLAFFKNLYSNIIMNSHASPHTNTSESIEEIRARILAAAGVRFSQYGYNKTTMAEIAKDCDMSAANLYRFFKNKLDIGAHQTSACLNSRLLVIQDVVRQTQRPAAERLHDVVIQILAYTHNQWAHNPRINEMVIAICDARVEIVSQYAIREHGLIIELLEDGIERGEFLIANVHETAEAIITAVTPFSVPLFMSLHTIETHKKHASNLIRLLLTGLVKH